MKNDGPHAYGKMKQWSAARMCRAVIIDTMDRFHADPAHWSAIDALSEGFGSADHMLGFLWSQCGNPENPSHRFGSFGYQLFFEWASPRKSNALRILTGKSRDEWLEMVDY